MMVISSSPSEDHSYTSVDGEEEYLPPSLSQQGMSNTAISQPSPPKKAHRSPTSSIDEAFSDDSYESDVARYVSHFSQFYSTSN